MRGKRIIHKNFNNMLTVSIAELPQQDPTWFTMLSANLTEEQKKSLTQILTTAEQKRNQKRSDAIEKSGGELMIREA
jgi:hypothetical protein